MLKLFSFYHLNLMFSSIPIEKRKQVISKCYWPLLKISRKHKIPIGIEASAYTLGIIKELDYLWIEELKRLLSIGLCELIGSGYSQIIGPLVPGKINDKNIEIGQKVYFELLNYKPQIALINEQAYSSSLINNYLKNGYKAIIMEWENPFKYNQNWDKSFRYYPHKISDQFNNEIILIWNQSTFFQQFQRYAHSDLELVEYLDFLNKFKSHKNRYISFYGSDAEIFDFRPGRYKTENNIQTNEWLRIEELILYIKNSKEYDFINISSLIFSEEIRTRNTLKLENASQPIPVKKQRKYNILRWANTGRDDLKINTRCHRIYEYMIHNKLDQENYWKEICYLWSSDFRTHITEERWIQFLDRLNKFEKELKINKYRFPEKEIFLKANDLDAEEKFKSSTKGKWLELQKDEIYLKFNSKKGLTLDSYIDKSISSKSIIGTLKHGFFDDISWMADFFTGHLVLEVPGKSKITDLENMNAELYESNNLAKIKSDIKNKFYQIQKEWIIDFSEKIIGLNVKMNSFEKVLGSLRLGHLTINPDLFDQDSLTIYTKNGGHHFQEFKLDKNNIDLGMPVSFLVSGNNAFGMTDGNLIIKDKNISINVFINPNNTKVVALLVNKKVNSKWFTRIIFSAMEFDDTSKPNFINLDFSMHIKIKKI